MTPRRGRAWALGLLLLTAAAAAQEPEGGIRLRLSDMFGEPGEPPEEAQDLPAAREGAPLLPRFSALRLELITATLYDDNVLRSETNAVDSFVIKVSPRVNLDGRIGRHGIQLGYEGEYGNYVDFSDENYFDHSFYARANARLSRRLTVNLDNGLQFGHDRRGAVSSRISGASEPDRWRRHYFGGDVFFGRAWAQVLRTKAGIGASFEQSGVRYLNNNQSLRNYDRQAWGLKGRYNLGPKLSLTADAGLAIIDYRDPATPLDSRETGVLFGVAWEATAKTTGEVKVGVLNKDFDDPSQGDFSGANYDAQVTWAPRSFSSFVAYASRDTAETGQGGGTAVVDTFGLRWRHGFSSRISTESGVEFQQADFQADREDEFLKVDVTANYSVNRRASLRGGVEYQSRSSNVAGADFDNSVVFVELTVALERRPGGRTDGN